MILPSGTTQNLPIVTFSKGGVFESERGLDHKVMCGHGELYADYDLSSLKAPRLL